MKRLIISTIVGWSAFLLMHGYYFFLGIWDTPHPSFLPLLLFVIVQAAAMLFAFGAVVFLTIRGPKRIESAAWGALAILPVFIWYSQVSIGLQMQRELRERAPELSWYQLSSEPIANAIIDGFTRYQFPYRLEGRRAVMFYDDRIEHPEDDLAALDAFIEQEETYLGKTMPKKLHWIRGTVLGLQGNAISGIAIADPELRHGIPYMELFPHKELNHVDYHEASHNIISIPSICSSWSGNTPPMLLIEGWPQARSLSWENLAWNCRQEKLYGTALTLEELVTSEYYLCAENRVYRQGGALVAVLLKHFGPEKFRELYFNCSQQTFRDDIKRVYGMTLEELDAFYWEEIDELYSFEKATENCSLEDKAILAEFRTAYDYQVNVYKKLFSDGGMESKELVSCNIKSESGKQSQTETESRFHAKDRVFFRMDRMEKTTGEGEPFERFTLSLQTPEMSYYAHHSSVTNEYAPQSHASCRFLDEENEKWRIAKSNLKDQLPYSFFFGSGSTLDDYLWSPQNGLKVESVTRHGEHVAITIRSSDENWEMQLNLDPKRHWTLLNATKTDFNDKKGWKSRETEDREFEGEIDGVPLLKKRTAVREYTGEKSSSHLTQTVEITKLNCSPVPDSVFDPALIPELKDVEIPERNLLPPTRRMHRHFILIAAWLLVPVCTIISRTRQTVLNKERMADENRN